MKKIIHVKHYLLVYTLNSQIVLLLIYSSINELEQSHLSLQDKKLILHYVQLVRTGFTFYLDGATPTRFGPSPRNSELGPSFSKIDLVEQKKKKTKTRTYLRKLRAHNPGSVRSDDTDRSMFGI